ncbi:serine aminopeptidase domain-containing protein [Nannocystis pusilla]|uniref:alpha/beta hydrolase family protein n=1 Tax=Nannocystis pusilla TaxID=889268 RepID=UPI003B79872F
MPSEDITLKALDGRPLSATLHAPREAPQAVLVVLGALGVPRRYYAPLAAWLAEREIAVLTFDYRGVGGSRSVPLRKDPAVLLDWARLDAAAAIDLARERWPGVPVWGLGHSFGGQAFGLTARGLDLAGIFVVAAGSGDMSLYPGRQRQSFKVRLGIATNVIAALFGYVPGRLGLGEDLPAGVVRQWAQWCDTPITSAAPSAPSRPFSSRHRADVVLRLHRRQLRPARAAAALRGWYNRAKSTHRVIAPADLGLRRVGHFGPFRAGAPERLWDELLGVITGDPRPVLAADNYAGPRRPRDHRFVAARRRRRGRALRPRHCSCMPVDSALALLTVGRRSSSATTTRSTCAAPAPAAGSAGFSSYVPVDMFI